MATKTKTTGAAGSAAPDKAGNSEFQTKADELFKEYPRVTEFHFTSDGTAFFEKSDAINHAGGLEEKYVQTIKNENDGKDKQ